MEADNAVVPSTNLLTAAEFDTGAARRLRRILKLLNLQNAVPESDAELMASQFSVFGLIASAIEARG